MSFRINLIVASLSVPLTSKVISGLSTSESKICGRRKLVRRLSHISLSLIVMQSAKP